MNKAVLFLLPWTVACVSETTLDGGTPVDAAQDAPSDASSSGDGGCSLPQTLCTKGMQMVCTDIATDDQNCGMCNNPCGAATSCKGSKCVCTDSTKTLCGTMCVDAQTDPKNCGACGHVCPNSNCIGGKCDSIVFVTDQTVATNLMGFANVDAKCQSLAQTANLSGKFMAWVSQSTGMMSSPSTRFVKSTRPYVLVDGTVVADSYAALTNGNPLKHAINMTQSKQVFSQSTSVMTSTSALGTTQGTADCSGWTGVAPGGAYGEATSTGLDWSRSFSGTVDCTSAYRLYCFEQP
jgi:hypothetical protein